MPSDQPSRRCELCAAAAAVHCPSDSAYLCRRCDAAVHAANFLVSRHVRSTLCSSCGHLSGERFSGTAPSPRTRHRCRSCHDDVEHEEDESSATSSSLSSIGSSDTESSAAGRPARKARSMRRGRAKADALTEGILVIWCRRLGLDDAHCVDAIVGTAGPVFGRLSGVRVRLALATSFWVGLRLSCKEIATWRNLVRVQRMTGVPAKMILALEARAGRMARPRGRAATTDDCQEGWAEC